MPRTFRLAALALAALTTAAIAPLPAAATTVGGTLSIFAGLGTYGLGQDGIAAVSSPMAAAGGLLQTGADGAIAIYDCGRVRAVGRDGLIQTIATGGTTNPFSWNCGSSAIGGIARDAQGHLFIADGLHHRVVEADANGALRTVAGNGTPRYAGDGGPATAASLFEPSGLAVDARGNLFIADTANHRVRKVDPSGVITTFAGGTSTSGCAVCAQAPGGRAVDAQLWSPVGLAVDAHDDLYVTDALDDRVLEITPDGTVAAVIGRPHASTAAGFSGDGGPAANAEVDGPLGVALDRAGNVYVADTGNARIRMVEGGATGTIRTVAGGAPGVALIGAPALQAHLPPPLAVLVDADDIMYISIQRQVLKLAPPVTAAQALQLPSARTCTSRRAFPIHVRRLPGLSYTSATVSVNGRRVPVYVYTDRRVRVRSISGAALNDRRFRAYVDLRGLARGTYAVRIAAQTTDGRTLTATRRYHTCRGRSLRGGIPAL